MITDRDLDGLVVSTINLLDGRQYYRVSDCTEAELYGIPFIVFNFREYTVAIRKDQIKSVDLSPVEKPPTRI